MKNTLLKITCLILCTLFLLTGCQEKQRQTEDISFSVTPNKESGSDNNRYRCVTINGKEYLAFEDGHSTWSTDFSCIYPTITVESKTPVKDLKNKIQTGNFTASEFNEIKAFSSHSEYGTPIFDWHNTYDVILPISSQMYTLYWSGETYDINFKSDDYMGHIQTNNGHAQTYENYITVSDTLEREEDIKDSVYGDLHIMYSDDGTKKHIQYNIENRKNDTVFRVLETYVSEDLKNQNGTFNTIPSEISIVMRAETAVYIRLYDLNTRPTPDWIKQIYLEFVE